MFSMVTVASSTRIPTARARPPRVMMLMVSPRKLSVITEVRMESGIDTAMMSVLRQLPRNSRIIRAVRHAATIASWRTPEIAPRTKMDWSASRSMWSSGGRVLATRGIAARMLSTTSRVEASPAFSTVSRVPRRPSRRTMLVCTLKPSRTLATSRR